MRRTGRARRYAFASPLPTTGVLCAVGVDAIRLESIGSDAAARVELPDTDEASGPLNLVLRRLTEADALKALSAPRRQARRRRSARRRGAGREGRPRALQPRLRA